jgi:hypothetical protein
VAIVLTQISSELFLAVGCGTCSARLLKDLRAELLADMPDARAHVRALLDKVPWQREERS